MHKLSQKRQLTVPQAICEAIQLQPGDYVRWCEKDGRVYLVKMSNQDLASAFSHLVGNNTFPELDTMKAALRQRAAKKHGA
jgi:hypothetical protein